MILAYFKKIILCCVENRSQEVGWEQSPGGKDGRPRDTAEQARDAGGVDRIKAGTEIRRLDSGTLPGRTRRIIWQGGDGGDEMKRGFKNEGWVNNKKDAVAFIWDENGCKSSKFRKCLHTLQTEKLTESLKGTVRHLHVSHRSPALSFGSLYSEFIPFIYLFVYFWHILHH